MTGPRIAGFVLAALSAAVLLATLSWPAGSGGVPGPALVPRGLALALLLVGLGIAAAPGTGAAAPVRHQRVVPLTMLLLIVQSALWLVVPFGVLSAIVLLVFFRLTGVQWRAALIATVLMAVSLHLLFVQGLGVRF